MTLISNALSSSVVFQCKISIIPLLSRLIWNDIRTNRYLFVPISFRLQKEEIENQFQSFLAGALHHSASMFRNGTVLKQSRVKKWSPSDASCSVTVTDCLLSGWNIAGVRGTARERERDATRESVLNRAIDCRARENDPLVVSSPNEKEFYMPRTHARARCI